MNSVLMNYRLLKRRQIKNSRPCAIATAQLLLRVVAKFKWTDIGKLLVRIQQVGQRLMEAQPKEMVVGNIVRRVLGMIREEAKEDRNEENSGQSDSGSVSQRESPRQDHGASLKERPGISSSISAFSPLRHGALEPMETSDTGGDGAYGTRSEHEQAARPPLMTSHTSYGVINGVPVQQSMFNLLSATPSPLSTPPISHSTIGKTSMTPPSLASRITMSTKDLKAEIISGIEE